MKVALCLHGLLGGAEGAWGKGKLADTMKILQLGYKHFEKHLLDLNDVDVFAQTYTNECNEFTEELCWAADSLYKPISSNHKPNPILPQPYHIYSNWASKQAVMRLKQDYENHYQAGYDIVMLARWDIALRADLRFDKYDPQNFYAGNWCRLYDKGKLISNTAYYRDEWQDSGKELEHKHVGYPHDNHGHKGLIDFWFFSNSSNMDRFCAAYDHLPRYIREIGPCNHGIARLHLEELGLLDKLKFTLHLHNDFPLIRRFYFQCDDNQGR